MPELPEVETTRRGVSPHIKNKKIRDIIIRQHQLRWPIPQQKLMTGLVNKKIERVKRRGKYLLFETNTGVMIVHLGMSGSLRITHQQAPCKPHDHVDFIINQQLILRYHDPRRFGAILWSDEPYQQHSLIAHLGPEPLTKKFNAEYLFNASRNHRSPIKSFIMNNTIVVGVGNIYATEALFKAAIHPKRPAGSISRQRYERLCQTIKAVLHSSIRQGGTTLRDFINSKGQPGYFKQQLQVYGRAGQPCYQCEKRLKSIKLGQRTTAYCGHCQK